MHFFEHFGHFLTLWKVTVLADLNNSGVDVKLALRSFVEDRKEGFLYFLFGLYVADPATFLASWLSPLWINSSFIQLWKACFSLILWILKFCVWISAPELKSAPLAVEIQICMFLSCPLTYTQNIHKQNVKNRHKNEIIPPNSDQKWRMKWPGALRVRWDEPVYPHVVLLVIQRRYLRMSLNQVE